MPIYTQSDLPPLEEIFVNSKTTKTENFSTNNSNSCKKLKSNFILYCFASATVGLFFGLGAAFTLAQGAGWQSANIIAAILATIQNTFNRIMILIETSL